jgi:hypothetical protein
MALPAAPSVLQSCQGAAGPSLMHTWGCRPQHSTAQHSTAQHSTAQHSTAQHSTAQHSTAQGSLCIGGTACHSTGVLSDISWHGRHASCMQPEQQQDCDSNNQTSLHTHLDADVAAAGGARASSVHTRPPATHLAHHCSLGGAGDAQAAARHPQQRHGVLQRCVDIPRGGEGRVVHQLACHGCKAGGGQGRGGGKQGKMGVNKRVVIAARCQGCKPQPVLLCCRVGGTGFMQQQPCVVHSQQHSRRWGDGVSAMGESPCSTGPSGWLACPGAAAHAPPPAQQRLHGGETGSQPGE